MQNKFSPDSFFGKVYAEKEVNDDVPGYGEFLEALENARAICMEYNESKYRTSDELREILAKLLSCDIDSETVIYPPFRCDIGFNIKLGKHVLINSNCFFLDSNIITIGDFVMITFPGELFSAIGLALKQSSPHRYTFISAYTNGRIGYSPVREAYSGDAYEASLSVLAPEWQKIFEDKAEKILNRLQ